MAGWSAMAGTHQFVVPDDTYAQGLAEALAEHGFPLVTARPAHCGGWMVIAFDEGPYPVNAMGHRQIEAAGREAAAVARQHAGYAEGGSRCDVAMLPVIRDADAPIVVANPGARPRVPEIVVVQAPPSAVLALTPDQAEDIPIDLTGVGDIPWADLSHAHGSAEDIPALLRSLADPFSDWDQTLDELFGDDLLHQGTCYSATAPSIPFLTKLITSGALPVKQRLDLYVWLIISADRWADSLIADADRAAVQDRPPQPEPWTDDVHRAVGEQLPQLLARWQAEPPAGRFVLACLAGLFPHHGGQISNEVAAMGEDLHGTQPGAYLRLAAALINGNDDLTLTIATEIVAWEEDHDPDWLDAPGLTIPVRASHVLAAGALRALSNIE